ncbi:MAG: c-type cytochrome [Crocinitomicaceae bacterium]|nr:c-type cytochrome [Crocinitomicaceae bacterium]
MGFSQIGKNLFKAKCNTCHHLNRDATGSDLTGVKAKWEAAGEADLLYEWVNSNLLKAQNKSAMAAKIDSYSKREMPNQDLTIEEINAIFSYVDSVVPTFIDAPPNDPTTSESR